MNEIEKYWQTFSLTYIMKFDKYNNLVKFHPKDRSIIKHSLLLAQKYINMFSFSNEKTYISGGIVELRKYSIRCLIQLLQAISIPISYGKHGADYEKIDSKMVKDETKKGETGKLPEWRNKYYHFNEIQKEAGKSIHYFHLLSKELPITPNTDPQIIYHRFGFDDTTFQQLEKWEMANINKGVIELFRKDCEIFNECLDIFDLMILRYLERNKVD
jgi:hypothetical protein